MAAPTYQQVLDLYKGAQKPQGVPQGVWDKYIDTAAKSSLAGLQRGVTTLANVQTTVQQLNDPKNTANLIATIKKVYPEEWKQAEQDEFYAGNDEIIQQILDQARGDTAENKGFVDTNLVPKLGELDSANAMAGLVQQDALEGQGRARDEMKQELDKLAKDAGKSAGKFNEFSGDAWDRYAQESRGLNERDRAAEQRYLGETGDLLQQLKAQGYQGDATADAEALGAQRDALGFAKGAAGGALDYDSQAAKAAADAATVARQQEGLDFVRSDILSGGGEQKALLDQLREMSASPDVSAKERLMGELARREFETADKSNRDAVSASLAARGIRSGGQQIAGQRAAAQQMAQDRLLKELGMQSSALERQLGALNQRGQAANELRASDQAAQQRYLEATGQLRGQTFNEAFDTGSAADKASAANQGARLQGGQMQGDLANQMRSASDTLALANQNQQGISQRFQDQYAADEAARVGDVARDRNTVSMGTTAQEGGRYGDVYNAEQGMLDTNYGREQDARDYSWDASTAGYDADSDVTTMQSENADKSVERAQGAVDAGSQVSQVRQGTDDDDETEALKLALGERYNREAGRQASA